MEGGAIFGSAEISLSQSPVADGFRHAGYELSDSGFATGSAEFAVEIFAGHDVGGGHRPILGDFDIFLLENHVALRVSNLGGAEVPFDFVVGRDVGLGEEAAEGEAGRLLLGLGLGGGRRSGGLVDGL